MPFYWQNVLLSAFHLSPFRLFFSLRRDGYEFFGHGFQLIRTNALALFGKADQQGQIAQAVDLSRQAVR